ncbi:MAG TPA: hypothetical protein VF989_03810 [Polyangiaceae bacterium]|jgi:hypothetical protein
MRRVWVLACVVAHLLLAGEAMALERRVVVLRPRELPAAAWPQGTQAVIAELALGDYELRVQNSGAADLATLFRELESAAAEPETVGAVAVMRQGPLGIAYVSVRDGDGPVRVEYEVQAGAVAEGAVALRVRELLRLGHLEIPREPQTDAGAPEAPPPVPARNRILGWIGGGAAFSSSAGLLGGVLALGVRVPFGDPLAFDVTMALSPVGGSVDTAAGGVEVHARQATVHLVVVPWSNRSQSVGLGAGAGMLWVSESAVPNAGFEARRDSTVVALLSGRATWTGRYGDVGIMALLETGLAVPAVTIRADDTELARVGRPWTLALGGLGWAF